MNIKQCPYEYIGIEDLIDIGFNTNSCYGCHNKRDRRAKACQCWGAAVPFLAVRYQYYQDAIDTGFAKPSRFSQVELPVNKDVALEKQKWIKQLQEIAGNFK
ncbi:MAG: hypothetical protein LBK26_00170 [Rickettsiales bacterium]|jgi:hypothetical protein|nr:hypothetical protein [Rickettsiales bacterium]